MSEARAFLISTKHFIYFISGEKVYLKK